MKRLLIITFVFISALLVAPVWGQVYAASFKFDKTTVTVNANETFTITVTENLGTDQTSGSQAYILYDATLLEAQSVTAGDFFGTVSNNISSGKVFVYGYVDGTTLYKTGTGNLATITFKALKAGTGTLTFDCRLGVSDSSQIVKYNDAEGTNLIVCTDNNSATVTVNSSGSSGSTDVTPTTGATDNLPAQLPQTGIVEDSIRVLTIIGAALIIIGGGLRLVL